MTRQSETVRIELREPAFDWSIGATTEAFPHASAEIELDLDESVRLPAIEFATEQLARWAKRLQLPDPPPLAIGFVSRDGEAAEVGQGFVMSESGAVRATYDIPAQPLADVIRAYEFGLVRGDPRHVVVWPMPPTAGVGGAGWQDFEHALAILWSVWKEIGAGAGTLIVLRDLIRRFRRSTEVLEKHSDQLDARGFSPTMVVVLTTARHWSTDELAAGLDLSREETAELLVGLGFEQQAEGRWRIRDHRVHDLSAALIAPFHRRPRKCGRCRGTCRGLQRPIVPLRRLGDSEHLATARVSPAISARVAATGPNHPPAALGALDRVFPRVEQSRLPRRGRLRVLAGRRWS
jgi:hypothetical protein